MSFWDFLRELPLVDDLIDLGEAVTILLSGSDSSELASEAVLQDSAEVASEISSGVTLDYNAFRDEMYWTDVVATGQNTREWLLEKSSLIPVEKDSFGKVLSGQWIDPHTDFTSSDPADFDIDHRMPFREVMESYPEIYDLPREEQLTIYSDLDNLQVIHDDHNIDKGAQSGEVHASKITNKEFREQFLADYQAYKKSLEQKFSR